jgi:multidrug efflux pump subunit AcrB
VRLPQDLLQVLVSEHESEHMQHAENQRRQQALAQVVRKDLDVESPSSFVGIDGINATLNTGRLMINLKPKELRNVSAAHVGDTRYRCALERA